MLTALTKVERVSLAGVSLSSEQASSLLVRINVMIKMLGRFISGEGSRKEQKKRTATSESLRKQSLASPTNGSRRSQQQHKTAVQTCRMSVICCTPTFEVQVRNIFFLIAPKINAEVCNEMTLEA